MAVIILHPTEELKLINFQKELISALFTEGRILLAARPLWIPLNTVVDAKNTVVATKDTVVESKNTVVEPVETTAAHKQSDIRGSFDELNHRNISSVEFGELETTESEIYIPVKIETKEGILSPKLSLVSIYKNTNFTETDRQIISQKKQPVRQLKVFRLGNEKELSSISKCITEFKWCKLEKK